MINSSKVKKIGESLLNFCSSEILKIMTFETNIVELKKFLCANEIRSEMLKYTLKISWSLT